MADNKFLVQDGAPGCSMTAWCSCYVLLLNIWFACSVCTCIVHIYFILFFFCYSLFSNWVVHRINHLLQCFCWCTYVAVFPTLGLPFSVCPLFLFMCRPTFCFCSSFMSLPSRHSRALFSAIIGARRKVGPSRWWLESNFVDSVSV